MPSRWLTICIPTYGRADLLKETLLRFIPQAIEHNAAIAISDNSSDDITKDMIDEMSALHSFIRYRKNHSNLGFDRNLLNAVTISDTPFAWLFGDDDWPDQNAIAKIKKEIETNSPDVLIVNAKAFDSKMEILLDPNLAHQTESFREKKAERLFSLAWYCSFVGGIVVRKTAWELVDHAKFFDTGFLHTGSVFSILASPSARASFISEPLVSYRSNAAGWSSNFLSIVFNLWPLTIKLLPDSYTPMAKESATLSSPKQFAKLAALANLRRNGFLSSSGVIRYFFPFWVKRPFDLFTLRTAMNFVFLLCTPPSIIGVMLDVRKNFKTFIIKFAGHNKRFPPN